MAKKTKKMSKKVIVPTVEEKMENEMSEMQAKKKSSKFYYIALIVLLVGAAVYFGIQKYGNIFVVATVNGKPITRFSLWQRLEKQSGKQTLDQIESEVLIEQEAAKKGVKISDKELDDKIKTLETQFKGKAGLDQVLSLQGMTRDDLKTQLKYNLIVEKIAPKASVSNQEISDYYDKNQSTYGEELTDAVKSQIKNTLYQQKRSTVVTNWFDSIKKKAKINTYL